MSDTSRVGAGREAIPATRVGAVEQMPPSVRTGLTEQGALAGKPQNSGIDQIADDEEQVRLAGALLSQASTGSDVRFEKVAALRQKIETGTYGIPAEDVAKTLMDEMRKK